MSCMIWCAILKLFGAFSIMSSMAENDTGAVKVIKETWSGHNEVVTLVYKDDHVAIYYDDEVNDNRNITWPFEITSKTWKYLKETHGSFGPDPILYVILHATKYKQGCNTEWYREIEPGSRNQIDCAEGASIKATPKDSSNFKNFLFFVGYIIVGGEKMTVMQRDNLIGGRGMLAILYYDLMLVLKDPTEFLVAWKKGALNRSENGIHWFRDWFLPIYEQFGRASVLRNFFNITNRHLQEAQSNSLQRELNFGEFVHFWSGAAQQDLYPMAKLSINNSRELYAELVKARKSFPLINYAQTSELRVMKETWIDHNDVLTLVYQDDHVAIYYDEEVSSIGNITWPFEIVSKAWKYVKETYGPFGPDPLLYVIFHATKYASCYTEWYDKSEPRSRNMLDCAEGGIMKATPRDSSSLLYILIYMGEIVAYKEAIGLDEIDTMIGGRGMLDILWYDLTLFLKDPTEVLITRKEARLSYLQKGTFWFRDWYLPIYEQFGKTSVLQRFFKITNQHWQETGANASRKNLNLGEFVHIWSGAAQQDLYPMAKLFINNSKEFYVELVAARKYLPLINYTQTSELKVIKETWEDHDEVLTLVYQDEHVAIYYDEDVNKNGNITWPFEIVSRAWKYVKETYGPFGLDTFLYVIFHVTKYGPYCYTDWYHEREPKSRNMLDCGEGGIIKATPRGSRSLSNILYYMGEIVAYREAMALDEINTIVGGRSMLDIICYDLMIFLQDPTQDLVLDKEKSLRESQNGVFWFRDWFLPIYELFGEASVLKSFFNTLNNHSQKAQANAFYRKPNLGEFVHIWSGAANRDLLPTVMSFNINSTEFYGQLVSARKTFPFNNYTRANCEAVKGVIHCDEGTTCKNIRWQCNGKDECSDGSDEANCTACRSSAFKCARGGCVEKRKVCDDTSDCPMDDSDENNCKKTSEPKEVKETWNGHDQVVTLVYQDDHVVIYYDEDVNKHQNTTYPFEIISKGWQYVKSTYVSFVSGKLLYVILHATKYTGSNTRWYRESEPGSRNQIDCGEGGPIGEGPRDSNILFNFLYYVGDKIVGGEKLTTVQRDEMVGGRGMLEILWYDLMRILKDPTENLVSKKEVILKYSPKGIFWFRDWFLPIYELFGEAAVLYNFVNIANQYQQKTSANAFLRSNLGEFVHFWSGAAQEDLLPTAISSINNSMEFYAELVEARKRFPFITYTRANCELRQGVIRCDESATCKNIVWRCTGKAECSDGSDEENCTACRGSAFKCARGGCVERKKVCDFTSDCLLDDSDENNCTTVLNPKLWRRTWKPPPTDLERVYFDEHVVVYFESGINSSLLWVTGNYSQAWAHVKETYGNFAKNSRLGVVLRLDDKDQKDCDIYSSSDARFSNQNVIDCGRSGWALKNALNFQHFVNTISNIIRTQAKGNDVADNIDTEVSGNVMKFIVFYDLLVKLKWVSMDTTLWKDTALKRTWNAVYFFRDWFLPIYKNYGGSTALGNFYRLAKSQWGQGLQKTPRKYLNVGEFVHFWSGAAGSDLLPIALQVFNYSSFYPQLVEAKKNFPSINYTATSCRDDQFKCVEDLVCIRKEWQCNGIPECGDESDEANCTGDNYATKIRPMKASHVVQIVVGILVFVLLVASVGLGIKMVLYRTRIQKLQQIRGLTNVEVKEFLDGNLDSNRSNANSSIYSRPFISDYEIPRENLVIDEARVLGSGEFGIVKEGTLQRDLHSSQSTDVTVAVKMVKPNAKVEHFKAFLKEIKIMAFLGRHQNIASLLGTVTSNIQNCEVYVALEFCSKGDLLHFLRANLNHFQDVFRSKETVTSVVFKKEENNDLDSDVTFVTSSVFKTVADASSSTNDSSISTLDLLEWSRQIADGMNYLTFKKVIHGDLAARNVLLTENKTAKISDFGLSHQLIKYEIYHKTSESPLPWRWLAIESISSRTFSVHSDVWAFGVTLWEIFTLGNVPFPERRWDRRYINDLANGMRPDSPQFGNKQIYDLMLSCMKMVPSERISFSEISLELQRIKTSIIPEDYSASMSGTGSSCNYSVL